MICVACLAIAVGLGILTAQYGSYVDEGDTLAIAQLMSQGRLLYRDIFSHHFPFSYYWVATAFSIFGSSVQVARLSVLAFEMTAWLSAMWLSRRTVALCVALIAWKAVSLFYFGNLALYQAMGAAALVPIFVAGAVICSGAAKLEWAGAILVGLFSGIALLLNPLLLFPILITFGFLVVLRTNLRQLLIAGAVAACIISIYAAHLLWTSSATDFYRDAILFNQTVYAAYSGDANTSLGGNLLRIVTNIGTALGLLDPQSWVKPMYPIQMLSGSPAPVLALTSDKTFKAIVAAFAILALLRKQPLTALFAYTFVAAAVLRGRTNFDQLPLVSTTFALLGIALATRQHTANAIPVERVSIGMRTGSALLLALFSALGVAFITHNHERFHVAAHFVRYQPDLQRVTELTCAQPDVLLGIYPGDPNYNFLSRLQPVSRYLYLWPWVADVGLDDIVQTLQQDPKAVVRLNMNSELWGIPAERYLGRLHSWLDEHYVAAGDAWYISPALRKACSTGDPFEQ